MKFGENLKLIRNDKKISQEDLAERLGVSRQSVSKWETGENYPSMQNIMALCTIFKCKINELVHEDFTDINFLDEEIKMSVIKFKEEKQNKVKGLSKAISIIAIIGRIICYVGLFFIGIAIILAPIIVEEKNQYSIMTIKTALQNNNKTKLIVLSETALAFTIINLVLVSIVLLYLERLFKNISSGDTPFTMDNVRYIKKMAYLMIAVIVLPSGGGLLAQFITGMDLDLDFEMFNVIEILFLFSLAYIFEYGYLIQLDSKGKMYGDENE